MRKSLSLLTVGLLIATSCGGDDDDVSSTTVADTSEPASDASAASGTITSVSAADGGTVTSDDGALTLQIPGGALAEDTEIGVELVPSPGEGAGDAYELTPDGLTFSEPIEVSIAGPVDVPADADGATPFGVLVTASDGVAEALADQTVTVDGDEMTVSGTTTHFSLMTMVNNSLALWIVFDEGTAAIGDTWSANMSLSSFALADTGAYINQVDVKTRDPLVATAAAAQPGAIDWTQTHVCVGEGTTESEATVEVIQPAGPGSLIMAVLTLFGWSFEAADVSMVVTTDMTTNCTGAPPTTPPITTAPPPPSTSEPACPPVTFAEPDAEGVVGVTVNNECLDPLFYAEVGGADPFFHLHTQQDDVFLSLEAYTVYGDRWNGQTGTFPLDCNLPWGLCLIFDPDGAGPVDVVMWATGDITIDQLDAGGYNVTFTGTMPVSPQGTTYRIEPTTWAGP